jgi:hypothetical protein
MIRDVLAMHSLRRPGRCGSKLPTVLAPVLGILMLTGCGREGSDGGNTGGTTNSRGTGGSGNGGTLGGSGGPLADAAGTGGSDAGRAADVAATGGTGGSGGLVGRGGQVGAGGVIGAGGVVGRGGAVATGGAAGKGGALGSGGATGAGGAQGTGGAVVVPPDGGPVPDAPLGMGGLFSVGGAGGGHLDAGTGRDLPREGNAADVGLGPAPACPAPPPDGYHLVHFRYLWAGQRTFSYFPEPALMPTSIQLEVGGSSVTCIREMDRPWFACPVPDSYFQAGATWRAVDKSRSPEWNTVKPWPLPATPKEYWIRWYYGRPDNPRDVDPPNFKVFDYYPDATNGNWSATGEWNDSQCAATASAGPGTVGFGGWFPYQNTAYKYPYGGSLAYVYADLPAVQGAFDAFVFERYQLWKQNWVKYDSDACGAGTARVDSDVPAGTVSEGQGYGMAIAAAIGDKELFDKLWSFVRHFRSQAKYCGLMGWMWQDSSDCQPLDSFATRSGTTESAFDSDVDIGIGLVFAAMQWPEYVDAATDWLSRMEGEVNTKYGDGWNYPTRGDTWNKSCVDVNHCDYQAGTKSEVMLDYYPPGYFRVFGDFLAAHPPASGNAAANGQSHRDFWYKTAETVWEMVERCYDASGVHPGLMGNQGDIEAPCSAGAGQPYEWGRALWRLGIDAAWFGNDTNLPENKPNSSPHYGGKSRMQAKLDNIQDFYTSFHEKNPPEPNANRFATICDQLGTDGTVANCDPAYGHNSYTVNLAMSGYVSLFNDGASTTPDIRREAIEEAITTTVMNTRYYEESLGVYSLLFLTGNFPNPMTVLAR